MSVSGATVMRREIGQVPSGVQRVVDAGDEAAAVAAAIRRAAPPWVTIAARGTSDHAAMYAQYLIETQLGLPTGLAKPSVTTAYRARLRWGGGLLLAISQSGQSPDIVAVTRAARRRHALTVAITNDVRSPLARAAEHVLGLHAGRELAVPATKTYVAELAVLAALVGAVSPASGITAGLAAVPDVIREVAARTGRWLTGPGVAVVDRLAAADRALVLSRGLHLATAMEVALKLKEVCGIFAEAYSTADFAHGPRALALTGVPILVVQPGGAVGAAIDEAVAALRSDGRDPTILGAVSDPDGLSLPVTLPEVLSPLAFVVAGQLLVEATARRQGRDPDAPAGLAKITRTR